jgi:alpha-galactosidase
MVRFLRRALWLAGVSVAMAARAQSGGATNVIAHPELDLMAAARAGAEPRFNGAQIFGIRPGTPFLRALAVSGARPMAFAAVKLPRGLKLDHATGIISGSLAKPGAYEFTCRASNAGGRTEARLRIECGDTIALTPPMGWNSYDAFGDAVTEAEVMSNAVWFKEHLQPLGWDTIVVDFRWYDRLADGVRVQDPEGVTIDQFGRCVPAVNRFPSAAGDRGFKPLADRLHAMGLKFGIHVMRGIPRLAAQGNLPVAGSRFRAAEAVVAPDDPNRTCVWNNDMFGVDGDSPAGRAWYASVARQYADWDVDYIKCDDIDYMIRGRIYAAAEIEALSRALRESGRSILLSLSPGPAPVNCSPHLRQFANLWRISGDFWDNWKALNHNFDLFADWGADAGPGHWPDGDMIPFGHICLRNCDVKPERWTRFTRNEQLTLISLWSLESSPLMLGMNLPDTDDWTIALLANPEVLAIDQDALGRAARRMYGQPVPAETWLKHLADGSCAVGFFNRSDQPVQIDVPWRDLGWLQPPQVRDLWLRRDLGRQQRFTASIGPHGCVLLGVKSSLGTEALQR